jgi:hypothetical protein
MLSLTPKGNGDRLFAVHHFVSWYDRALRFAAGSPVTKLSYAALIALASPP